MLGTLPGTNRIRGYEAKIQSSSKKAPNFFLIYTLYEQGNNHPDTLFRTFNRSNMFIGGLSYLKTWKRLVWFTQGSYTRSEISGDNLPAALTTSYTLENQFEYNGNQQLRAECTWNISSPNLDSLNSRTLTVHYSRVLKQYLNAGVGFRKINYSGTSGLTGISLSCDYLVKKKYLIKGAYSNDRACNWWGVEGVK